MYNFKPYREKAPSLEYHWYTSIITYARITALIVNNNSSKIVRHRGIVSAVVPDGAPSVRWCPALEDDGDIA